MTSIPFRLLPLAACAMLLAACATTSQPAAAPAAPVAAAQSAPAPATEPAPPAAKPAAKAAPAAAPAKPLNPEDQMALQMHVMTGELAAGRKQPGLAAAEFLAALKIVDDADLAQRATSLALAARDEDLSMRAARRWLEIAPNESDPREVIARLALSKGDVDEAYAQCAAIVSGSAGGPDDGFPQIGQILSMAGKAQGESALKVMQKLTAKWPAVVSGQLTQGLLALRFDNLALADQSGTQALKLEPGNREAELLMAGVRVRQDRFDDADAIIERLAKPEKGRSEMRLGYARLLLENNQRERARAQLKKLMADDPKNPDGRYALAVLAYNDKDYDAAAGDFTLLLSTPRANEAAFQLGRIEEQRKHPAKALGYYGMVNDGPQVLDAAARRAAVLAQMGKLDEARDLLGELREQFPQYADRFALAEAEILSDAGQLDQALEVYAAALKDAPGNADLLYGRSLIYERQNQIDLAEKDLRDILKQDADDARSMNALGYMLTVHTQRFAEAQKLIARAHELDPDDPAIMDSLGWVDYKLGDKNGARDMLSKALDKLPDPEIAAHLGEVLWAMGEKDQARSVWDKALANDPDHRVLKETVQRYTKH